jgi:2-polyprenyl-3-methyl-5-hydroxy-6-metoxy-1,4-benzoquinol methylase
MSRINLRICPICNSTSIVEVLQVKDHKITQEIFSVADCSDCKQRFTLDPPIESTIGPYYDSPRYISHSDNTEGIINRLYHMVRGLMLKKKLNLIQKISNQKDILDIGSGTGYFLNTMKNAGYTVYGIELNENARDYSKQKFQLEILPPNYLVEEKFQNKFSIASMWHVLEHIYNPSQYLEHIYNVLHKDGILVIAVPNYTSTDANHYNENWAGYDVPRHLWHFSPTTIKKLLERNGFQYQQTYRLPFDSFYVSMLSESYQNSNFGVIKGVFFGFTSWLASWFNIDRTSSLIYVFKKV